MEKAIVAIDMLSKKMRKAKYKRYNTKNNV